MTFLQHIPKDVWMALSVAAAVIIAWKFLTGTLKFISRVALLGAILYAAYRLFYSR